MEPTDIAVNESTGEAYVVDRGNKRVERFNAKGEYLSDFVGASLKQPEGIAVDNSHAADLGEDPSAGDVYVATHTGVDKFTSEGVYIGRVTSGAEKSELEHPQGVAVDSKGQVWVDWSDDEIDGFNDGKQNERLSEETITAEVEPLRPGLAVDSEDDLYVSYEPGKLFAEGPKEKPCELAPCFVAKLTALGEPAQALTAGEVLIEQLDGEDASAVAVDLSDDDAYVDNVTSVAAFTSRGALVQRFGAGVLQRGSGVAVDGKTRNVFVVDAAADRVDVFAPEPPGPPTLADLAAQDVTAEAAELTGAVDPSGLVAEYHFEYGPARTCTSTPLSWTKVPGGTVGGEGFGEEGFGEQQVSARLGAGTDSALLAGVTYRYRLVASESEGREADEEEGCFSTLPASKAIADEREWEMASSPEKGGAAVEPIPANDGLIQASENGQAITYFTQAPVGDPEGSRSPEPTQMISVRGARGWTSQDIVTANERGTGLEEGYTAYQAFSTDLSLSLVEPYLGGGRFAEPPLAPSFPGDEHQEKTLYLRSDAPIAPAALSSGASEEDEQLKTAQEAIYTKAREDGVAMGNPGYLALVNFANVLPGEAFGPENSSTGVHFVAATPDLTHVVLTSVVVPLTPKAPPGENLYEWEGAGSPAEGKLQLINVLPGAEEVVAPFPRLGSAELVSGRNLRHAISDDGARIVWSDSEDHLYMRDTADGKTIQLDQVQGGEGTEPVAAMFQDASAEGSEVFFTDTQRLTPGSGAGRNKPDLYVFDVETGKLTDLTKPNFGERANVQGLVLGASEDGSYVYFVADGVLSGRASEAGATPGRCRYEERPITLSATCNLYLAHYDSEAGHEGWEEPRFIASLSNEDEPDWEGPGGVADLGEMTASVSPNGHYLAFMSNRSLTNYDNRATNPSADGAPAEEVFLFDTSGGSLVCASCDPSGARPVGVFDPPEKGENPEGLGLLVDRARAWAGTWLAGSIPGWTKINRLYALYQSRYLSNSGRLLFNSPDALVSQDTNGKEDVYEYEPEGVPHGRHECTNQSATFSVRSDGCVGLISSGTSANESAFLDASVSGGEGEHGEELEEGAGDVFFVTSARLSPQDTDSSFDVYDAHECTAQSPCMMAESGESTPSCDSTNDCRPFSYAAPTSGPEPAQSFGPGNLTLPTGGVAHERVVHPPPGKKLAEALKSCRKLKRRSRRAACEKSARRKYGRKRPAKMKKGGAANRRRQGRAG